MIVEGVNVCLLIGCEGQDRVRTTIDGTDKANSNSPVDCIENLQISHKVWKYLFMRGTHQLEQNHYFTFNSSVSKSFDSLSHLNNPKRTITIVKMNRTKEGDDFILF